MARHVEGRRVEGYDGIERGGDYFVKYGEDRAIVAVIFAMPGFDDDGGAPMWNRINGPAGAADGPRWEVTEDAEGRVTCAPSILSEWTWGEDREPRRFHVYLKAGVWEVLDDTVGGVFDEAT